MSSLRLSAKRLIWAWAPAVIYTLLIWWLSSQALVVPALDHFPLRDKGVHFVEYLGLGLCIARAVHLTWPGRGIRASAVAVLITASLGLIDELHQVFVPGRSADLADLVADTLGSVCASAIVAWWMRTPAHGVEPPLSG